MEIKKALSFLLLIIFYSCFSTSAEINKVKFTDNVTEKNKILKINGLAVRTYMFTDVYAAALYLPDLESNAAKVLDAKTIKLLKIHYFTSISKEDLKKVWAVALLENCQDACAQFRTAFSEFDSATTDVKNGTEITYYFDPHFVEVRNSANTIKILKDGFDKVLLSTWIGPKPPTEKVKNGLLGKK